MIHTILSWIYRDIVRIIALLLLMTEMSCTPHQTSPELSLAAEQKPKKDQKFQESKELKPHEWAQLFHKAPTTKERQNLEDITKGPDNSVISENLLEMARKHLALGNFAEAESLYRQFLQKESQHPDGQLEMAMALIQQQKHNESFQILEEIRRHIAQMPSISKAYIFKYKYTLGLAYLMNNNEKKCRRIMTDLINQDKTFTPGYAVLGSAYYLNGKTEVAEFIVQRGMERGAEDPSLYNLMGLFQMKKRLLSEATFWFDKALSLNQEFVPALINKATLAFRQLQYKEAEALLKQSIQIHPAIPESYIILGAVYMKQNRPEDARLLFEKVLRRNPQNTWARYNMGLVTLFGFKKPFRALQYFEEAIQTTGFGEENIRWAAQNFINNIKNSDFIR
ncbi:MAG: tetratricopeptide repeat protein [Deltaproteobacteria bacterium]|nr:tetratricopeptide repeat protein [Deltaproteobacteria bacterium]